MTDVDRNHYAGRWYVIANIPYFAEVGNVGSYFGISFQPGDKLTDVYTAFRRFQRAEKSFTMTGYVVAGTGNARWREKPILAAVSVLLYPLCRSKLPDRARPLSGTELRLGVGAPTGHRGRIYESLLGRRKDQGYDIGQFRRVPQFPAQIGHASFQ